MFAQKLAVGRLDLIYVALDRKEFLEVIPSIFLIGVNFFLVLRLARLGRRTAINCLVIVTREKVLLLLGVIFRPSHLLVFLGR